MLKKRIWLNFFIRYLLENYLVLIIAYMLKMYSLDFDNTSAIAMSTLSIIVFLILIACPILVWMFLYKEFNNGCMEDPRFHELYGSLVLELNHKKEAMLFNVLYMFRRIAMAFIIVALPNLNWL